MQPPQDRLVDAAMAPQLRAAMHDAVRDGNGCRQVELGEQAGDADHRATLVRDSAFLRRDGSTARILGVDSTGRLADGFRLTRNEPLDRRGLHVVQAELER